MLIGIQNANGGAGNDTITGNINANILGGAGGKDTINAGAGNDTIRYTIGDGLDTIDGGADSDTLAVSGTAGDDTIHVIASGLNLTSIEGMTPSNVESYTLDGLGNGSAGDTLSYAGTATGVIVNLATGDATGFTSPIAGIENVTGGGDVDSLTGDTGNNVLDGGAGGDTMVGGAGDDTYVVDNNSDTVTEITNEGTDTALSSISYELTTDVENLTLTGNGNIDGTGNELANVITGNGGNNTLDGGIGADTLIGGAGNDTYVVDDAGDVVTEAPSGGTDTVQASISYTLGAEVENLTLTGGGNISGTGNGLANVITGNTGDNTIDGGIGADTMDGGAGNDTYVVDDVGDVIAENGGEGTDTVQSSIGYVLAANVENLTLTGAGNINATGNSDINTLTGNSGNNTLDGLGGADTMSGGAGNDTYVVDNTGDVTVENANEGIDTVQSSASYTLSANIENLTLTGNGNIDGTGNGDANAKAGNSGNNTLDGGLAADSLAGGAGNDTYVVDDAGDLVTESANEGTDTVQSSIGYVLVGNVENLTLTGSADINGTGNSLGNTIIGNIGNNTLDGGANADSMAGGAGNDTYVVDDAADTVTELSGEGTDTVLASVTYALSTNVENLTLTGNADIDGTGNAIANVLTGNGGNNTLDGLGGADTMVGGAGNDTYVVDNAGDVVTENANEGTDTVLTSVSYTLTANVENLILTGNGDISASGNGFAQSITGNSGNNTLDGGAGAATMVGGLGDDTYVVDDAGDVVTEAGGEGTDTVQSSIDYVLGANIENLTLTGAAFFGIGTDNGNVITGNAGVNVLVGLGGNDTLDGGGGADGMFGGLGNDTYFVDAGDGIVENADEGVDTVNSSGHYRLSANLENLNLLGSADLQAAGNSLANTIIGNAGNNILDGDAGVDIMSGGAGNDVYFVDDGNDATIENANEGNDTVYSTTHLRLSANVDNLILQGSDNLQGAGNGLTNILVGNDGSNILDGGAGTDAMFGGAGGDAYFVDNAGDVVIENSNEGNDVVFSTAHLHLSENVEYLVLQGSDDLQGAGNSLANILVGNAGDNILTGDAGADSMFGGAGNDIYFVDNAGDIAIENANEGADTVFSTAHFHLSDNVENLVLQGSDNLQGAGNDLNNVLYGNIGNNILTGGAGADIMVGGAGNDVYFVDNTGDLVFESIGAGTDAVFATVNYTLMANVETLVLQGSNNLSGTGNASANAIHGNSGANTLNGGAGADVLVGNGGNDTFVFTSGQADGDRVVDFTLGDQLQFAGFGAGTFAQVGVSQWEITSGIDAHVETITLSNGAVPTNFLFL